MSSFHPAAGRFAAPERRAPRVLTDNDLLKPETWELAALAVLVLAYATVAILFEPEQLEGFGVVGSLVLAAILLTAAYRMVMRSQASIWLGLLWYRISTAIYFGVGSMIHIVFDMEATVIAQVFFYALPIHYLKVNIISALSALILLSTVRMFCSFFREKPVNYVTLRKDRILLICSVIFMTLGFGVKFYIVLKTTSNISNQEVIPALLASLALFAPIGLFLLTTWTLRYSKKLLFIPLVIVLLDMFLGTIQFNKSDVLKPLLVVIIAFLFHRPAPVRLLIAAGVVVLTYQTLIPIAEFGRVGLIQRYGNIHTGSLTARAQLVRDYFDGQTNAASTSQGGLARIAYAGSVAPAIAFYDNGDPGESWKEIFYVFIPRVLWPEKPIMDNGLRYNERVNGQNTSASWMGIAAEGYWNLGWFGVAIYSVIFGLIMFVTGKMAISILAGSQWFHFPIVLFQFYMGVRTDGSLVLEVIVSFVLCLIVYGFGNIADKLIRPLLGDRGHSPQLAQSFGRRGPHE